MPKHTCRRCEVILTEDNCSISGFKYHQYICRNCNRKQHLAIRKKNPSVYKLLQDQAHVRTGRIPYNKNKDCAMYLGVHIAERVLSKVFKDVKQMPITNPGYDFICSKNMKIDVKSSCRTQQGTRAQRFYFNIKKNKTPDYFLCLGFDNRDNLTPIQMWLIPGHKINHQKTASISESKLHKWDEYRVPIDQVVSCCEVLKT